jgi:AraC family transcriptional regulator
VEVQSPASRIRHITHSQAVSQFTITEAIYAPHVFVNRHSHRLACFGLVLQGSYIERYGQRALECKPLHVKFRPAGIVHADLYGRPPVKCFFIETEEAWLKSLRKYSITLNEPSVIHSNSLICLAMKIRREALHVDAVSPLVVEGLMLELVAEAERFAAVGEDDPRWLKRAREILHDRFAEPLTLKEIGEAVGVHPVYLATVFRKRLRRTVGEYLRQLRIDFACREISTSDTPLAQISLAAGFAHQSQFSRTFKRVTGVTPARYRSAIRS